MKEMFEETIQRVLDNTITPEVIAAAETGLWPATVWQTIEDNGLTVAAAPESLGGVGGSWHDAYGLVRASGRYAVPAPLAETILANWLLGRVGLDAVAGPVTIGECTNGSFTSDEFSGTLADVAWGRDSTHVITIASGQLILLRTSDATTSQSFNIAREPRDTLCFDRVAPVRVGGLTGTLSPDAIRLGGAMIRAAQIAGALQRLLETAVDYANQRTQFGKPIGQFQVIQHQIAVLAEHAALTSSAAEAAFAESEDGPRFLPVAVAKSTASEAAGHGASIAHGALGAIGFTYEHSLHFTTRRLWSWRSEFGAQTVWAQALGVAACAGGGRAFWESLTTGTLGR